MPDGTGAPIAPQSPFAHRLDVLKRYRRRVAGEARKRRRVTAHRVAQLERLIARIVDASEVIAHVEIADPCAPSLGVCLLTVLHRAHFQQLCELGAELEDDEDGDGGGDDEDSEPDHDGEPSLGSCDGTIDQERWHDGGTSDDRELDRSDLEPSLGSFDDVLNQERWAQGSRRDLECEDENEPSLVAAEGANANLRAMPDEPETDRAQPAAKMAAARGRYRKREGAL